ncbi:MAG: EamA family transporter RarD [Candidatus Adiutrix sp.]|jgi:chloramphenicol-sensitive protein RarD|nr:EamA family transporter RarD [Candidatus Adiutrix sp.]
MISQNTEERVPLGTLFTAISLYVVWGLLPIYWKMLETVPALDVLAHRIVWAFFFMIGLIWATGRGGRLWAEMKTVLANRRKLLSLLAGSIFVSINWLTYIWAVTNDRMVESSLGYYINPLLQVLLGVIVFRERLSLWQFLAIALAATGVLYLTVSFGSLPMVAALLAGSFTAYGYCKKITGLSAVGGMTMETALLAPVAATYLLIFYAQGQGVPVGANQIFMLLLGTGVITAVPLIIFAHSINRLPMTVIGLVQFVSPTMTLLLGIFAYHEAFSRQHFIAFSFIWSGCALFALARTAPMARLERGILRRLNRA